MKASHGRCRSSDEWKKERGIKPNFGRVLASLLFSERGTASGRSLDFQLRKGFGIPLRHTRKGYVMVHGCTRPGAVLLAIAKDAMKGRFRFEKLASWMSLA